MNSGIIPAHTSAKRNATRRGSGGRAGEMRLALPIEVKRSGRDKLANMTNRVSGTMMKAAKSRKVDAEACTQEPGS